ncbi:heme ABC exporter ATP-binding protein CcmA [Limisalsivibrio acetivorans]|uniref:heme ABC exporter ATP-binding protein CcmA n=1 Tax=Limisalsivibrio acetivorans TaxID=1304888 RepID=UPI0003B3711F|nr:heme ABC exporter ATP-binding protein CcmA [Limisalsivibrio acetivorans]
MAEAIFELDKVKKRYGHTEALRGVSFTLARGEFLSVFGPNGAGKSTLLKLLSTLTKPTEGDILFEGTPLKKLKDDFRRHFGIISHQPYLYENLTARENLDFYGRLYGVKELSDRIAEILERVELSHRKHDRVRTFSRGMLQRLSIARALIHDPDIILLDEPYTGLDQHASMVLTGILREQFTRNKSIVMVTHNLPRGYELASRIAVMKSGRFTLMEDKNNIPEREFEDVYLRAVG